jgi:hypothetical protein
MYAYIYIHVRMRILIYCRNTTEQYSGSPALSGDLSSFVKPFSVHYDDDWHNDPSVPPGDKMALRAGSPILL